MRGLLAKDIQLLLSDKRMLTAVLGMMVVFSVISRNMTTVGFVVGYASFLAVSIALSTFSWDDFDKSGMFLLTMPVTRRTYVMEKYVYGLLCLSVGWGIAMLFTAALQLFRQRGISGTELTEWLLVGVFILFAALLMLMLMVPLRLKFGTDKGRMVQNTIVVAVVIAAFVAARAFPSTMETVESVLTWMLGDGRAVMLGLILAVTAALCLGSVAASLRIIMRREF